MKLGFTSSLGRSARAGEMSGKPMKTPAQRRWSEQVGSSREVCEIIRSSYWLSQCLLNLLRLLWHFAGNTGPVALQVAVSHLGGCRALSGSLGSSSNLVMKHTRQSAGQWTLSSSTQMNIRNTIPQQFSLLHIGREKQQQILATVCELIEYLLMN